MKNWLRKYLGIDKIEDTVFEKEEDRKIFWFTETSNLPKRIEDLVETYDDKFEALEDYLKVDIQFKGRGSEYKVIKKKKKNE